MAKNRFVLEEEKKKSGEEKLMDTISSFFEKNWKIVTIVICALLLIGLGIGIGISIAKNNNRKGHQEIYNLEFEFDSSNSSEDPQWDAYINKLSALVKDGSYKSVKASYLIGLAEYDRENYSNAYDAFMKAYELNKTIYLAPLALCNAAGCLEEMDNVSKALELYNQVYTDYQDTESAVGAKALFNSARIYLQQNNVQVAKTTFEQCADYYPYSEYGKMALSIAETL